MEDQVNNTERTILLVDDEENIIKALVRLFRREGYRIFKAGCGREGLELLKENEISVIVSDQRMPEMTGDEVLETLRDRGYEGRVVMVTALDPGMDIVDMDFEQYVCKPIGRDELRTIVRQEILRAHYDDTLQDYLRLQSKVNALEDEHPSSALDADQEARALRTELDGLRDKLLDTLVEHARFSYEAEDLADTEAFEDR
jgi:response regulator RpfG family c-di-GMP phosphodiesterase